MKDHPIAEKRDRVPGARHGRVSLGWGRALARLMKSHSILNTQTALAKQSGVTQSTIGRILRGTVDPHSANVERIATAFGLTYSALAQLAAEGGSDGVSMERQRPARPHDGVPILSSVPGSTVSGGCTAFEYPAHVTHWIAWPRTPRRVCTPRGPRTVAYPVLGEAMAPDYPHGCIIYVDPDVAAAQGKDVIVWLPDRHQVHFARLAVERARRYLRSIHPLASHEVIPLSAEARILGVVVGRYVDV